MTKPVAPQDPASFGGATTPKVFSARFGTAMLCFTPASSHEISIQSHSERSEPRAVPLAGFPPGYQLRFGDDKLHPDG